MFTSARAGGPIQFIPQNCRICRDFLIALRVRQRTSYRCRAYRAVWDGELVSGVDGWRNQGRLGHGCRWGIGREGGGRFAARRRSARRGAGLGRGREADREIWSQERQPGGIVRWRGRIALVPRKRSRGRGRYENRPDIG